MPKPNTIRATKMLPGNMLIRPGAEFIYPTLNLPGMIFWEKSNNQLSYKIVQNQIRSFKKQMYYLPIPRSETQKTDLAKMPGMETG